MASKLEKLTSYYFEVWLKELYFLKIALAHLLIFFALYLAIRYSRLDIDIFNTLAKTLKGKS